MTEKTIELSIDLVEAALKHRQFLQLVDAYPSLYAGSHVHNAIRRFVCLKIGKGFQFQVQLLHIVRSTHMHALLRSQCNFKLQ